MKNLFKSQTSYKLLVFLIKSQNQSFSLAELAKQLQKDPANVFREIDKLIKEDLVSVTNTNNKKVYSFNSKNPLLPELSHLINKLETNEIESKFKTEWMLAEDIPNMCPFFSKIWLNCFVTDFKKLGGKAYQKITGVYRDYHLWFYYDKKDAYEVGEYLVDKMESNPDFMDHVNSEIIKTSDILSNFSDKVPGDKLDKLSNKQLFKFYTDHIKLHSDYYIPGWIPVAADMFCDNLTERGKKILRDLNVAEDKVNEYLSLLTQPTKPSLLKIEQDNFKQIGIKIQEDAKQLQLFQNLFKKFKEEDVKLYGLYEHSQRYEAEFNKVVQGLIKDIRPDILKDLQKHYTTYFYTKFLFTEEQGVYDFDHYLKSLVRMVNYEKDIKSALKKENEENTALLQKRKELIKQLKLSQKQKQFFAAWGDFMVTKIYRRFAQIYALYRIVPIIEEIANRIGLTIKQTKFMTTEEVQDALLNNKLDKDQIKKRVPFCVYYADNNEQKFYSGEEGNKILKFLETKIKDNIQEIKGQCGCQGIARGTVRIVDVVEDMKKMQQGDILVAISTQPDLLPAMKKASAFVTDQGGVTSHAAIVAREMNTPCVIGTKIATKVLKDGMEVEVDATKGIVKIV